jgi:hypothetical protein
MTTQLKNFINISGGSRNDACICEKAFRAKRQRINQFNIKLTGRLTKLRISAGLSLHQGLSNHTTLKQF